MNTLVELAKEGYRITLTETLDRLLINPEAVPYITAIKANGAIIGYIDARPPNVPLFIRQVPKS